MEDTAEDAVKSESLHFRLSVEEKSMLKRLAHKNQMKISTFVLKMARFFEDENMGATFVPKAQPRAAGKRAVLN